MMNKSKKILAFLIAIAVLRLSSCNKNRGLEAGDDCETSSHGSGVCVLDRECPHFLGKPQEALSFMRSMCGADVRGEAMTICCPARKSFKKCVKLGDRPKEPLTTIDKITHGIPAEPYEFPQFASLAYEADDTLNVGCGGVLISNSFVLTAAHCFKSNLKIVKLGYFTHEPNVTDYGFDKFDVKVKRTILHPDYNFLKKNNDIALIELDTPVSLSYSVWPACLTDDENFDTRAVINIAGFGLDKDGGI
jgi:hypothetical protein